MEAESGRPAFVEPLIDVAKWFLGLVPTSLKPGRPHFNFLTVHYIFMIGMTIVGSILLYPAGIMKYIDALFFAAGSATQSGLNTINVNDLYLYQQIVMITIAWIANPIFINTVVVFVRLYWFEKRFQGIAQEARARRSTISRSRSQARAESLSNVERGVNGRQIRVLHQRSRSIGRIDATSTATENEKLASMIGNGGDTSSDATPDVSASTSSTSPPEVFEMTPMPRLNREITFADEAPRPKTPDTPGTPGPPGTPAAADDVERMPDQRSPEHHIAFLERQRKQDKGTLRIPGPRDFDRGDVPEEVESSDEDLPDDEVAQRRVSRLRRQSTMSEDREHNANHIAFDVPSRPSATEAPQDAETSQKHRPRFNPLRPFSNTSYEGSASSLVTTLRNKWGSNFSRSPSTATAPHLALAPTFGRNSAIVGRMTEEQREALGGIEYRSLKTLAIILVVYFLGFNILGAVVLIPWITLSQTYGAAVDQVAQNRVWWGIFTPASMFTDLGFTLTPASMVPFNTAVLPLLFGSFLIIIGNTGFPCMLRFTIWVLSKFASHDEEGGSPLWEELRFLLDHPRRCFTLLFPSKATWWLFWLLVVLNGIDLIFFIILDLNDSAVTVLAPGDRVLAGWFQAVSTRTAGFACVNLAALHPAIQVSYMVMMYISVFPIAISVRRTNVYEEKSLGIWGHEDEDEEGNKSYVGTHLRRQLSFDLWYIFLGVFVIAICEGNRIQNDPNGGFSIFAILFEVVSAYGTVGLSLGYPGIDPSLSAEFSVISKLVIIAMMLRGRHRGLPYSLDRAILLPSEHLNRKEAEHAARREDRRMSMAATIENTATNQNLGISTAPSFMTADQVQRSRSRRMSEVSTASERTAFTGAGGHKKHSLSRVLSAAMGAGPTHSRRMLKDD